MSLLVQLITQRDILKDVPRRWDEQYNHARRNLTPEKEAISAALRGMDLESVEPSEIDALIGNRTWTSKTCDGCKQWAKTFVLIQYEDWPSTLMCASCIVSAHALLKEASCR